MKDSDMISRTEALAAMAVAMEEMKAALAQTASGYEVAPHLLVPDDAISALHRMLADARRDGWEAAMRCADLKKGWDDITATASNSQGAGT